MSVGRVDGRYSHEPRIHRRQHGRQSRPRRRICPADRPEPKNIPDYQGPPDATIDFGGWTWRYDLVPIAAGRTEITLTYDWSNVSPHHQDIEFPPFPRSHLENSLRNLAELAEQRQSAET
jgi:hypothetical protein